MKQNNFIFNIENYIKATRHVIEQGLDSDINKKYYVTKDFPLDENIFFRASGVKSPIYLFAEKIFQDTEYKVKMLTTYSCDVFPDVFFNKESKEVVIVWDLFFWHLCERFMGYMLLANTDPDAQFLTENLTKSYKLDMLYFLSYKYIEDQKISLALAQQYEMERNELAARYFLAQGAEMYVVLSQRFALLHERNHFLYHTDSKTKDFSNSICEMAKIILDNEELFIKSLPEDELKYVRELLISLINKTDENLFEEIFCDVAAMSELMGAAHRSGGEIKNIYTAYYLFEMARSNMIMALDSWDEHLGKKQKFPLSKYFKSFIVQLMIKLQYTLLTRDAPNFDTDIYNKIEYSILRNAVRQIIAPKFITDIIDWSKDIKIKNQKSFYDELDKCFSLFYLSK